jgi:hypothetical protein
MKLSTSQREQAKEELLNILSHGEFRTSELSGTPKFHGERTLRPAHVLTLLHELRKAGKVWLRQGGQGMYTYYLWSLPEEPQKANEWERQ